MASSPAGMKFLRLFYRLKSNFFLLLFLFLIKATVFAGESFISRQDFLTELLKVCFGKNLNEIELLQTGLLDPFPDGKFHLDWPITRAGAARVCYKILKAQKNYRPIPGFFADVPLSTELYSILANVGGIFTPLKNDTFVPDAPLTNEEKTNLIGLFSRHLPNDRSLIFFENKINEKKDEKKWESSFPLLFPQQNSTFELVKLNHLEKVASLVEFIPANQLVPQKDFNLREAAVAMSELENNLTSLELSILDLVNSFPEDKTELDQLKKGLQEFRDILLPLQDKLRFSSEQLKASVLLDEESIAIAGNLEKKLAFVRLRLANLKERINLRLQDLEGEKIRTKK